MRREPRTPSSRNLKYTKIEADNFQASQPSRTSNKRELQAAGMDGSQGINHAQRWITSHRHHHS